MPRLCSSEKEANEVLQRARYTLTRLRDFASQGRVSELVALPADNAGARFP
jgi:hypothetical protein